MVEIRGLLLAERERTCVAWERGESASRNRRVGGTITNRGFGGDRFYTLLGRKGFVEYPWTRFIYHPLLRFLGPIITFLLYY